MPAVDELRLTDEQLDEMLESEIANRSRYSEGTFGYARHGAAVSALTELKERRRLPVSAKGVTREFAGDVARTLFPDRWGEGTGLTRSALTVQVQNAIEVVLGANEIGPAVKP